MKRLKRLASLLLACVMALSAIVVGNVSAAAEDTILATKYYLNTYEDSKYYIFDFYGISKEQILDLLNGGDEFCFQVITGEGYLELKTDPGKAVRGDQGLELYTGDYKVIATVSDGEDSYSSDVDGDIITPMVIYPEWAYGTYGLRFKLLAENQTVINFLTEYDKSDSWTVNIVVYPTVGKYYRTRPVTGLEESYLFSLSSDIDVWGFIDTSQLVNKTYTGKAIKQKFKWYDPQTGEKLVEGEDYTLKYSDNVNVGTASITVTGIGDYSGTAVISFTIAPKKTTLTVSSSSTKATLKWKKSKGADGYEIYYSKDGGQFKKLATTKAKVLKKTVKIDSDITYRFKVRPYAVIDGKKVYGAWSKTISV